MTDINNTTLATPEQNSEKAPEAKKTFADVVASEKLVLVDFFAEWCGPCKMMAPILQETKSLVGNGVKILKVDVERNTLAASTYRIAGVPTLILFKNGEIVWRQSGVVPARYLADVIAEHSTETE